MTTTKHGLSIGIERIDKHIFLSLKAVGTLTHDDYTLINPLIESALEGIKQPQINVLVDGTELRGWELRAAWDDFKLGLKYNNEFKNIAIVGNKHWQELAAKVGSWFISGNIQYFENIDDALNWLHE